MHDGGLLNMSDLSNNLAVKYRNQHTGKRDLKENIKVNMARRGDSEVLELNILFPDQH
jgi:hypothetical protein